MGIQTVTIKTCDRCGARILPLHEVNETGELTVSWSGDQSAIAYDGAAGGISHKGSKLLCLSCMRGFFEFMEKPAH